MPKAFTNTSISQRSISIKNSPLSPSVKQIGSPYKGVQKNPHDQSVWEWQPCPGLAIIRPHECLSSPLLSVEALTVTHPAMTVTPAQRASRRQGPTTSNEAVKGPCSWTVATNTSWSSPTAQQQTPTAVLSATASTEKRCTAQTSFPSLQPPSFSLSPCQVVLVLTSSLRRHKGLLKCLRMLYGCMTGEGWHCWGSESIQDVNEIHSVLLSIWSWVTLDLSWMMFELQKSTRGKRQ